MTCRGCTLVQKLAFFASDLDLPFQIFAGEARLLGGHSYNISLETYKYLILKLSSGTLYFVTSEDLIRATKRSHLRHQLTPQTRVAERLAEE